MDNGLLRLVKSGLRFAYEKSATTYVGFKLLASPATSIDFALPTTLPGTTQTVTVSPTGQIGYAASGGTGTVTSVGLAAPSDLTVTGSPITTSGTITIARASQSANLFLGSPNGTAGAPVYRALVANDIPSLLSAKISDFDTQVRTSRLDQMAAPTAAISANNQRITGLADPTGPQDAATRAYVDATTQGLDVKESVRAASTANVTISSPGSTIDGVNLNPNDRVLLKAQTNAAENGIYVFNSASTAMVRAVDANTSAKVTAGMFTFVQDGGTNADSGWILSTDGVISLGTTGLSFTQFSGAGQIDAGSGLTKIGNQINVVGSANRIFVTADNIDIAANYAGQSTITTLGTITTGTWTGATIALANGGTGATTASAARANLSAAGVARGSFTNANLTSGILTITHALGQQFVIPIIWDENGKRVEADDYTALNSTTLTVDMTFAGTITGTWNYALVG